VKQSLASKLLHAGVCLQAITELLAMDGMLGRSLLAGDRREASLI